MVAAIKHKPSPNTTPDLATSQLPILGL